MAIVGLEQVCRRYAVCRLGVGGWTWHAVRGLDDYSEAYGFAHLLTCEDGLSYGCYDAWTGRWAFTVRCEGFCDVGAVLDTRFGDGYSDPTE